LERTSGEPPVDANISVKDILEDIIEDPATEIINEDQKPKLARVQSRRRGPKNKRR
jgi:hypothetical protein